MPAYNEEQYIGTTLASVVQQTRLPKAIYVVNDGSVDRTENIIKQYVDQFQWINLINHGKKAGHSPGAKVIRAFYLGYQQIQEEFDVIVKLDADLELPNDYFEKVMSYFETDSKIGICGGTLIIQRKGKWIIEHISDHDHVKGPTKSYRKECFKDIGGLLPSVGWDTVDELLAQYHGWTVKADKQLQVKHFRHMGGESGPVKHKMKIGNGMYRMRYGLWIAITSALKTGYLNKPHLTSGIAVMRGWLQSWWKNEDFIVSPEEGKFIRQLRWRRMKAKLFGS